MARLNIETSINKEHAFQELLILVGDRKKAKGFCWELWELAQEFWFPEKRLIPEDRFKKAGLEPTIEAGLAVRHEGGIYARGSEEMFAWLFQKMEAGKASAEAKKKKPRKLKVQEQRPSTPVERPLNARQHPSTSLLSSLSSSLFSQNSILSNPQNSDLSVEPLNPNLLFEFWNANRGELPVAQGLSEARIRKAKAQLKKYPDIAHWMSSISKLASSNFCVKVWRPGFDDFLSEEKRLKALEGIYDRDFGPETRGARVDIESLLAAEGKAV